MGIIKEKKSIEIDESFGKNNSDGGLFGTKAKLLIIVEAFAGGIYTYLNGLLNNVADEYDITVLYALRSQTPKNFEKDFDRRIKFIRSKYLKRSIGPHDFKAFFEIRKVVKQIKPDIIHCHSSKVGALTRVGVNTRKNIVFYTPHGYSFLMEDSSKLKRAIYWFYEKIAAMNHATTIACSKGEYEATLKLTKRATYISNGVDLEDIKEYIPNNNKKIDSKHLSIITTSRINYQKNPSLFNKIAESFPNIKFIWVGEGDLQSELSSKNIEVTGWKTKDEIMKLLNKSDVFILPSLWEGLSISLLEAMALKKPCIVSNVIGNKDVIENEKNGFVCNNLEDYIKVINNILNDKYDLDKIVNNAYKDVLDIYNTKVMSDRYKKIYQESLINKDR